MPIPPNTKLIAVAGMTAVLWVIPSFGTQGMGTIRQAYRHPDRALRSLDTGSPMARALLEHSDRVAAAAVLRP